MFSDLKKILFGIMFCVKITSFDEKAFILPVGNTAAVLSLAKNYLPENPIIVEAGAYDGNDSIYMSKLWPKGKIYTFEPVPALYKKLLQKVKPYSNIYTFPYALGDSNQVVPFYVSAFVNTPNEPSASSSLLEPKEHLSYANYVVFNKIIDVQMHTLDYWGALHNVDHVDMLWLDMQGYELNMLKASQEKLHSVKVIYTEVIFIEAYKDQYLYQDIVSFLSSLGFRILAQDFVEKEVGRWYGNILFIKELS